MNVGSSTCASSGNATQWEQVDWPKCERHVRRLQARIVKATREGRWGKVKALQRLLTHSCAAKALAVKRVTENQGNTVQRLLERFQQDTPKLPRRKPQLPNRLLRTIPMGRLSWETSDPGSLETDLVHHCGTVAAGEYVHTQQLVDIATGWSERVAVLGRSQETMVKGFKRVQARLPFPITHRHPDNGSEFFNRPPDTLLRSEDHRSEPEPQPALPEK